MTLATRAMNDIDERKLKEGVRAMLSARPTKGKIPQPTKRNLKRRFRLEVVRGKPRMVEVE